MKVGYNIAWPVVFIVLGVAMTVVSVLQLASSGEFQPTVFLGPLFVLLGVLQFGRVYFEFDPRTRMIAVKPLIGSWARRFGGSAGGRLSVVGGRIVCTLADGRMRKVPVSPMVAKREQWDEVLAQLR